MTERVLIAYGSRHGSTAETADAIAGMLRERGLEVEISEADRVTSVAAYNAVVVGGSVYTGRWHPEARKFVKRFAAELRHRKVALFAMGPKTSWPEDLASARQQLDIELRRLPDVSAEPIAVFGGVIDPSKLHFPFSRMHPSDARDWDDIEAFADRFADRLAALALGSR